MTGVGLPQHHAHCSGLGVLGPDVPLLPLAHPVASLTAQQTLGFLWPWAEAVVMGSPSLKGTCHAALGRQFL